MTCPECNSARTRVIDGSYKGSTRNVKAALKRLVNTYTGCIARMRVCANCDLRFFTVEVQVDAPDPEPVQARLACAHVPRQYGLSYSGMCPRTAFYIARGSCAHDTGPRCRLHRCAKCLDIRKMSVAEHAAAMA